MTSYRYRQRSDRIGGPTQHEVQPRWGKGSHLKLQECPVEPPGVVGHPVHIRKCLDTHFDLTRVVQNTAATVHIVHDRRQIIVRGRISENSVVPDLEVRVVRNELRKRLPLVRGGDETRAVRANGGRRRVRGLEGVCRPCKSGVVRGVESGGRVRGRIGLRAGHRVRGRVWKPHGNL